MQLFHLTIYSTVAKDFVGFTNEKKKEEGGLDGSFISKDPFAIYSFSDKFCILYSFLNLFGVKVY